MAFGAEAGSWFVVDEAFLAFPFCWKMPYFLLKLGCFDAVQKFFAVIFADFHGSDWGDSSYCA